MSSARRLPAYTSAHDVEIVRELTDFLAIPNLASDTGNIRRNAEHLIAMLGVARDRGAACWSRRPADRRRCMASSRTPGATKTVVFYAHYDGQPVDTDAMGDSAVAAGAARQAARRGRQESSRFRRRPARSQGEWRLYGRSASDDKAPIIAMLTAIDALRASGIGAVGESEVLLRGRGGGRVGTPRTELLERNAALLRADAWLFGDGPVHQSRRQQIVFGVRGVTGVELTVYGPSHGLHSGHYGNWAPNPVTLLANLMASMRNDDGRILIKNFYDDVAPITAAERRALASVPAVDSAMRAEVSLGATEAKNAALVERIMLPALNLRGIRGGGVGATARTRFRPKQRRRSTFASCRGRRRRAHPPARRERTRGRRVLRRRSHADGSRADGPRAYREDEVGGRLRGDARRRWTRRSRAPSFARRRRRSARPSWRCRRSAGACRCTRSRMCCTRR